MRYLARPELIVFIDTNKKTPATENDCGGFLKINPVTFYSPIALRL